MSSSSRDWSVSIEPARAAAESSAISHSASRAKLRPMLRTSVTSTAGSMNPVSTSQPTSRSASTSASMNRASVVALGAGEPERAPELDRPLERHAGLLGHLDPVRVRGLPRIARSSSS